MAKKIDTDILWSDRKRGLFGLPWSFTKYVLTEEKLLITRGVTVRENMMRNPSDSDHDGYND